MKKNESTYQYVSMAVLMSAAVWIVLSYNDIGTLFRHIDWTPLFWIIITAFLVHTIKAARLFLILYGSNFSLRTYLKTYCKITLVCLCVPFKLGDLFRIFYIGKVVRRFLKGVVAILLDRFMDTLALVTFELCVCLFGGGRITFFVVGLILFLAILLIAYLVFPSLCLFWKKFLLQSKATDRKLTALKVLEMLNRIYHEVGGVVRGRGLIVWVLSMFAWAAEIGGLALYEGLDGNGHLSSAISEYLSTAMGIGQSEHLRLFVFISIILLCSIYFMTKLPKLLPKKKIQI